MSLRCIPQPLVTWLSQNVGNFSLRALSRFRVFPGFPRFWTPGWFLHTGVHSVFLGRWQEEMFFMTDFKSWICHHRNFSVDGIVNLPFFTMTLDFDSRNSTGESRKLLLFIWYWRLTLSTISTISNSYGVFWDHFPTQIRRGYSWRFQLFHAMCEVAGLRGINFLHVFLEQFQLMQHKPFMTLQ